MEGTVKIDVGEIGRVNVNWIWTHLCYGHMVGFCDCSVEIFRFILSPVGVRVTKITGSSSADCIY
jgi:hypothetical protein